MLRRQFEKLLLRPEDLRPSRDDLEVIGTFNPGAVQAKDQVVLLIRVAERPRERRDGLTALPRWDAKLGIVVDWAPDAELEALDPRVVRRKRDGLVRLTFISHLRVMRSADGRSIDDTEGTRFEPQAVWEEFGVEDPRITPIGERFYFTYVAVSRHGAATALASTADFETFRRHGIIFCPENKDVALFPEKIDGHYVALHRPNGATPFTTPEMWIARSANLTEWGGHEPLQIGAVPWGSDRIGGGTPPLRTEAGWLEIYHGSRRGNAPGEVGAYSAGALLLDLQNPARVIRQSVEPVVTPQAEFERCGFVPNVVFPTGVVERGDSLLVYYGAADTNCGVVELSLSELMASLE